MNSDETQLAQIAPPADEASFGARLGLFLLVAVFGLPTASILFLGAPAAIAGLCAALLEQGGVPTSALSDPSSLSITALAIGGLGSPVVFLVASFKRRKEGNPVLWVKPWLLLGGIAGAACLGTTGLELAPKTSINPEYTIFCLTAVTSWSALSLAHVSGRLMSRGVRRLEIAAARSGSIRGAITAGGPSLALGVGATVAVAVAGDLPERAVEAVEEYRALPASSEAPLTPAECFDEIYANDKKLWRRGVQRAAGQARIGALSLDAEDFAVSAAISTCEKEPLPTKGELEQQYLRAARDQARDSRRRRASRSEMLTTCQLPWGRSSEIDDDVDCMIQLVCTMEDEDQRVLRSVLLGATGPELARELEVPLATAKQRRNRATKRLADRARVECR